MGGAAAVSAGVLAALGPYATTVQRLDNATYPDLASYPNDRYGTDAAVVEQAFPSGAGRSTSPRLDFPDALGAAAAAGHSGAPVLLVTPHGHPGGDAHALSALNPTTIYAWAARPRSRPGCSRRSARTPRPSNGSTTRPIPTWRATPTTATAPTRRWSRRPSPRVPVGLHRLGCELPRRARGGGRGRPLGRAGAARDPARPSRRRRPRVERTEPHHDLRVGGAAAISNGVLAALANYIGP